MGHNAAPAIAPADFLVISNSSPHSPTSITRSTKPTPAAAKERKLAQKSRDLSFSEIVVFINTSFL